MAKVIQFRRGTTDENNAFTGAEGEITVDTTTKTLVVHDGSTKGGNRLLGTKELEERVASGEFKGEKGDTGATGATGATGTSVSSVVQTTTSTADGGTNVITVTLSNGTTSTFSVKNGSKGSTGSSAALQTTGVTADWYGQASSSASGNVSFYQTIYIPRFYVDAYGRITSAQHASFKVLAYCRNCDCNCDCDCGDDSCFVSGCLETKHGLINVHDIRVGDELLSDTGEYVKVVGATHHRLGRRGVIKLKEGAVLTDDHPILLEKPHEYRFLKGSIFDPTKIFDADNGVKGQFSLSNTYHAQFIPTVEMPFDTPTVCPVTEKEINVKFGGEYVLIPGKI